jgi:hypothetical protein
MSPPDVTPQPHNPNVLLSVVIPTITGREDWLERCLAAYKELSPANTEFIVVKDKPTCGHAWVEGYRRSSGTYVHFTADDIEPLPLWWREPMAVLSAGRIPAATVMDSKLRPAVCDSPVGELARDGTGRVPNVLVPFLSRDLLAKGGWLLPVHYGSDDWVAYRASQLGYRVERVRTYQLVHHVANHGRNYLRRYGDVQALVDAMDAAGYVPPVYRQLEINLRSSTTGLDSVSLKRLNMDIEQGRIIVPSAQPRSARARAEEELHQQRMRARENARKPKVYIASQFKNEVDVLEIRLGTIGHLADIIVIAEATVDQRGRPKRLVFPRHEHRFRPWADKIRYVVVDDMPVGEGHEWDVARERHQRDALIRGMEDLRPHDLVYVSDLDEIPYPEALEDALANPPMRFGMDLHLYRLNWRWLDRGCRIGTLGAVVFGKTILENSVCYAVLWDSSVPQRPGISGWHLTYQGDADTLRAKITGMMDKAEQLVMPGVSAEEILTDEWIVESILTGRDIFGRTYRNTEWVDVTELPAYVLENIGRFKHMLIERPANQDEVEASPRCSCGAVWTAGADGERVLAHFPYCRLADEPGTLIHADDRRLKARALDV